jgi:hypothetical protein
MGGVNRVTLVRGIGKYGVEVRYAYRGAPCASFMLVVSEQGPNGKDGRSWHSHFDEAAGGWCKGR